tara:strand:- start:5607 stop:7022 length:1416 start_codon:yes stop_codon:yes gene_type:complete
MVKVLAIDLDGTLIKNDLFHEAILLYIKKNPLNLFKVLILLIKGKVYIKRFLAEKISFNDIEIIYNRKLISWIKEQRGMGFKTVLISGSPKKYCRQVYKQLKIFDHFFGTAGNINMTGSIKVVTLKKFFKDAVIHYVGNAKADIQVWRKVEKGYITNSSKRFTKKMEKIFGVQPILENLDNSLKSAFKLIRFHQWLKNILIFVPFFAAQIDFSVETIRSLFFGFLAFSLLSSAFYIINDISDINSDRQHSVKRKRPLASTALSLPNGILLFFCLITCFFATIPLLPKNFLILCLTYSVLTCVYSYWLKKVVILDCFVLSLFYMIRILGGSFLLNIEISFWLLAFSIYVFLSLGLMKRYSEILIKEEEGETEIFGRGYRVGDKNIVLALGVASAYSASIILCFYINSSNVLALYPNKEYLWIGITLIIFWLNYVWFCGSRGKISDDPVLFAIKDKVSIFVILGSIASIALSI